jgi:SagB-type dehydrogenase family enzyme
LRSAPSAGATYPIEIYAVVNRVAALEPGVYRYEPEGHVIEVLRTGDLGDDLSAACMGQSMPLEAAVSLVMTAVPQRTTGTYGTRGIMYIYMEAGHISQNVCLQCTSLGLGVVPIGAFDDDEVNQLVGADGESETALYVNSIGRLEHKRGESD